MKSGAETRLMGVGLVLLQHYMPKPAAVQTVREAGFCPDGNASRGENRAAKLRHGNAPPRPAVRLLGKRVEEQQPANEEQRDRQEHRHADVEQEHQGEDDQDRARQKLGARGAVELVTAGLIRIVGVLQHNRAGDQQEGPRPP